VGPREGTVCITSNEEHFAAKINVHRAPRLFRKHLSRRDWIHVMLRRVCNEMLTLSLFAMSVFQCLCCPQQHKCPCYTDATLEAWQLHMNVCMPVCVPKSCLFVCQRVSVSAQLVHVIASSG
jgi:hypothetical protein